ncbi:MAG: hypothetical protein PGMFKBFP_03161 [Anaerolineales bacterium]|nr:hypothetical protein [Anaerolineales bacterium]
MSAQGGAHGGAQFPRPLAVDDPHERQPREIRLFEITLQPLQRVVHHHAAQVDLQAGGSDG